MISSSECTAADYLQFGARVTTIPQLRIAARAVDYGVSAIGLAVIDRDPIRAASFARTAATLAKLAFTDLEEAA